jgi:hypothetical protein
LRWHVERRVEGPPYIMKQSWISGNPRPCRLPWNLPSCHLS